MIAVIHARAAGLGHLREEIGLGARVELGRLPVDATVHAAARALAREALAWATGGGEDYELLLTCAPEAVERLAEGLAGTAGTRLSAVGEMTAAADGIRYLDAGGRAVPVRAGVEHFVTGRGRAC